MSKTLRNLFREELAERYDAERQLALAMPRMIDAVTCPHLITLIQLRVSKSEGHIKTLYHILESPGMKTKPRICEVMRGLLGKLDRIILDFADSPAINAAIVSIFQKIEHQAIVCYGCLREWAAALGKWTIADSLEWILDAEKSANQSLIELARTRSNSQAFGRMHLRAC